MWGSEPHFALGDADAQSSKLASTKPAGTPGYGARLPNRRARGEMRYVFNPHCAFSRTPFFRNGAHFSARRIHSRARWIVSSARWDGSNARWEVPGARRNLHFPAAEAFLRTLERFFRALRRFLRTQPGSQRTQECSQCAQECSLRAQFSLKPAVPTQKRGLRGYHGCKRPADSPRSASSVAVQCFERPSKL